MQSLDFFSEKSLDDFQKNFIFKEISEEIRGVVPEAWWVCLGNYSEFRWNFFLTIRNGFLGEVLGEIFKEVSERVFKGFPKSSPEALQKFFINEISDKIFWEIL